MCDYYVDMPKASRLCYQANSTEKVIQKNSYLSMGVWGELLKLQSIKKEYVKHNHQNDIAKVDATAREIFETYENQFSWFGKLWNQLTTFLHLPTEHRKVKEVYLDVLNPYWRLDQALRK